MSSVFDLILRVPVAVVVHLPDNPAAPEPEEACFVNTVIDSKQAASHAATPLGTPLS